jgi:hypothetical protein
MQGRLVMYTEESRALLIDYVSGWCALTETRDSLGPFVLADVQGYGKPSGCKQIKGSEVLNAGPENSKSPNV